MSLVRCFIGLPLGLPAESAVVECANSIREADPHWGREKWVRAENLHVTVNFIGDVDRDAIPDVIGALSGAMKGLDPPWVRFVALEPTPRAARASLIWIRCDDGGTVARLAHATGEALSSMDDSRPFVPHVTLVRARRPLQAPANLERAFSSSELGEMVVSEPPVTLFSSQLTPQGPVYTSIATWQVKGA